MATERKIGREIYRCEKLPAEQGLALFAQVNDTFAGDATVFASLAAGTGRKQALAVFLGAMMRSELDGAKVQGLIKQAAEMCAVNGEPAIMGHKPQEIEDAIEVAWFALEVQFKDFLAPSLPDPDPPTQAATGYQAPR